MLYICVVIRTDAHDVFVSKVIAIVEETVGGERHDQDAEAEIGHAQTTVENKKVQSQ